MELTLPSPAQMFWATPGQRWKILRLAGAQHLKDIKRDLLSLAPEPGSLVLVHAQRIPRLSSTFDSVILSAMDVRTHLQTGRMYFVSSMAATIDFLDHVVRTFPFPIHEIRTDDHGLFSAEDRQMEHRFTLAAHKVGIRHSIGNALETGVESLLRWYFFRDGRHEFDNSDPDGGTLPDELGEFLRFHNRLRRLPTLGGKTPLEALRSSRGANVARVFESLLLTPQKN